MFGLPCSQLPAHLVRHPVEPRPDGHRLDLASPVHALVVSPRLTQRLVQSSLELLDPHHHVEMSLGVLLYHVPHVVGFSGLQVFSIIITVQLSSINSDLLELPSGHEVLDLPN